MPISQLGALKILKPAEWAAKVKRALRESEGSIDPAAAALGISRRLLLAWLQNERGTGKLLEGARVAPRGPKPRQARR